ncbi:uncharacterized protein LOC134193700 [Corticium candelabrum]|uniref:uncharacterized protein LOC134193700 n=1 Tax=Corticium candelabrum TaxID=121492 RepID=UPI002E2604EB|nr:uncharacterized protein LOC134193700 [Corticium candelabrum]
MAGNSFMTVSQFDAKLVDVFKEDTVDPKFSAFDLDMNQGTVTLHLSESVFVTTLVPTFISVLSSASSSTPNHTLTGGSVTGENGPTATIRLSKFDENAIKADTKLATNENNTYMSVESSAVRDTSNVRSNAIQPLNGLLVRDYTKDKSAPELEFWDLRLSAGNVLPLIIVLRFTETVNLTSLDVSLITLHSGSNGSSSNQSYTLTGGNLSQKVFSVVEIEVTRDDLDGIKALDPLLLSRNTSFLSVKGGAVLDMVGLSLVEIAETNATQVSEYTADLSTPVLESYELDMNSGTLILTFSEIVVLSSFTQTKIKLQSSRSCDSEFYWLTGGNATSVSPSTISVEIVTSDFNAIKAFDLLAADADSTFISLQRGVVTDPPENEAAAIPCDQPLRVATYVPDTTRPQLLSYDVETNTKMITFRFDESVNTSSLDPTKLTVQNKQALPSESYTLVAGTTTSANGLEIVLQVNITDKNAIKALGNLFTSENNTYISFSREFIKDMAGNGIVAISRNRALKVTNFTEDLFQPYLQFFDVDMDSGILNLQFDETVNVSSLDTSLVCLRSAPNNSSFSRCLSSCSMSLLDRALVPCVLQPDDLNYLKRVGICAVAAECYLSLADGTVLDMVGHRLREISVNNSMLVRRHTADTTGPQLSSFYSFDLSAGTITLRFSETVNASSLMASAMRLQSLFEPPFVGEKTLTGGVTNSTDGTEIVIQLTSEDVVDIKSQRYLCTRRGNCYITLTKSFISDMKGNEVDAVTNGPPGKIAELFVVDKMPPNLVSFHLDLNSSKLSLTFDEAVNVDTLDASQIAIQMADNTNVTTTLTGGSSSSPNGDVVLVDLLKVDIDRIKAAGYASSANDTYLSLSSDTVQDMAFSPNKVNAILSGMALQALLYTEDSIAPVVDRFTLDMDADELIVTFSEPVRLSNINATFFQLDSGMGSTYGLTGGSIVTSDDNPGSLVITVKLTEDDIVFLKLNKSIATTRDDTLLTVLGDQIYDMAGNTYPTTSMKKVETFVKDATPPTLTSFSIDMNVGQLNLTFNDVISSSSFMSTAFTIQDAMRAKSQYTLKSSTTDSPGGYDLVVDLSLEDVFGMKSVFGLARDVTSTYLTMRATAVDDHLGVDVIAVTDGNAFNVRSYVSDTTLPVLLRFVLDLNAGTLRLEFSKAVNRSTFDAQKLTLQSTSNITDGSWRKIIGGSIAQTDEGRTLTLSMLEDDLNPIKKDLSFATNVNNTYLSLQQAAVLDFFSNELSETPSGDALQAADFIADRSGPELRIFELDMNTAVLTLTFSETVNASSVQPDQITIQGVVNASLHDSSIRTLTTSTHSEEDGTVISIYLSDVDANALKLDRSLAVNRGTSFLSLTALTVRDMNDNLAVAKSSMVGLRARRFRLDRTDPSLVSFEFDRNAGTLKLTFTEVVDVESFDFSQITVQRHKSRQTDYHTLTGGEATAHGLEPVYTLKLTVDDQNEIKRIDNMAMAVSNTYLSLTTNAVYDMNNNFVVPWLANDSLRASRVRNDTTPPLVASFDLDMDAFLLNITFDEVVRTSTSVIDKIWLQSRNVSGSSYQLKDSTHSSANDVFVTVSLSVNDANAIKLDRQLATEVGNSYLNLTFAAIEDMTQNVISERESAVRVSVFTPDTTSHQLKSFNLSLDSEQLTLSFDEAVDVATLNPSFITLRNTAAGIVSEDYKLTDSSTSISSNGDRVVVDISLGDLNAIKDFTSLATSINDTFLQIGENVIRDMNGNRATPIAVNFLQVSSLISDTTRPRLQQFDLDISNFTLHMFFSETVNISSFDVEKVTLQNSRGNPSERYTLTANSTATRPTYSSILVSIGRTDMNEVKILSGLGTSSANSFISMSDVAVKDMSGNRLVTVPVDNSLQVRNYTTDSIRPVLTSFDIDMNDGRVTFHFTETVNVTSFDLTDVTVLSRPMKNATVEFSRRLNGGTIESSNGPDVEVVMLPEDLNEITRRRFCMSSDNCYLSITANAVRDMFANYINEVKSQFAIRVSTHMVDRKSALLAQFTSFDLDSGILSLRFSETINSSTVQPTGLWVQNYFMSPRARVYLSGGTVISNDSTLVTIQLTNQDLNAIKLRTSLCTDETNCYVRLTPDFAEDMAGNNIEALNVTAFDSHHLPLVFTDDITSPQVVAFDIDMNAETVTLSFDETVQVVTTEPTSITIQNALNATESRTLESSVRTTTADGTELEISFSLADLTFIKSLTSLATNLNDTYITYTNKLIKDMKGNEIAVRRNGVNALEAIGYVEDKIEPTVESFSELDMNLGLLSLSFSEPIDIESSILFDDIRLQRTGLGNGTFYNLTGGEPAYGATDKTVVELTLTAADVREIKLKTDLATRREDTFVGVGYGTFVDMTGNRVRPVNVSSGLAAVNYIKDSTSPNLLTFNFDVDSGVLTLVFDDVVLSSSFDPTGITLQNSRLGSDASNKYTLTSGVSNSPNGYEIVLNITFNDLNEIKRRDGLTTSRDTTFLTLRSETIEDVAFVPVTSIVTDRGQQVVNFTADTTIPYIERFSVDLTEEVVKLRFSEMVDIKSLDATQITLQDSRNRTSNTVKFTLTGGTPTPNVSAVEFSLYFTQKDLNSIKALTRLGTEKTDSFIVVTSSTIRDMNGNPVREITSEDALQAVDHTDDFTLPEIVSYDLDMDEGILLFTFSETVNTSSLITSRISIQNAVTRSAWYTLTGGGVTLRDSTKINVTMTVSDLNEIKSRPALAVSNLTTYLAVMTGMVKDMTGNSIAALANGVNPQRVATFTPDTTVPDLVCFDLDLTQDTLTLRFNETVNGDSVNMTQVTLHSNEASAIAEYTFTNGTVTSGHSTDLVIRLTTVDVNAVKAERSLATRRNNTFLSLTRFGLTDMNANRISALSPTAAYSVCAFTHDSKEPELVDFDLDMDANTMTLRFSESVNVASLDMTRVTLGNGGSTQYTFTGGSSLSDNGPTVVVNLTVVDLNEIKDLTALAVDASTTYLSMLVGAVKDMNDNELLLTSGKLVTRYTVDRVPPALVEFNMTMRGGVPPLVFILTFSETVYASSLSPTELTLMIAANSTSLREVYTLTGGNVSTENSTVVELVALDDDRQGIKTLPPLGQTVANSFLSITSDAMRDMAGNAVTRLSRSFGQQVKYHTADLTPPVLNFFDLDMDSGELFLTFSEDVILQTFISTRLTLQSLNSSGTTFKFTGGEYKLSSPSVVVLTLLARDLNEIKRLSDLAISKETTYLYMQKDTIRDLANNEVSPINTSDAQWVKTYTPDTTRTTLLTFDIDMNSKVITLEFDETVNATSFQPQFLTIQNHRTQPTEFYTLTGGSTNSSDGTVIRFTVTFQDKNEIKARAETATEPSNTYLSTTTQSIRDMAGNTVRLIRMRAALAVRVYVADAYRPNLLTFDVDMDAGLLILHFDETVNITTLRETAFTLQDNATTDKINHTLTTSLTSDDDTADVTIVFSAADLNEITRKQFCISNNTCYLTFEDAAVFDMVDRAIDGIPDGHGVQVSEYTPDTSSPSLSEFTSINLETGVIVLTFNETVNITSLQYTSLTLQSLFEDPLSNLTLSGGETLVTEDTTTVAFKMVYDDLVKLKTDHELCTRRGTCYVTLTGALVRDMRNNKADPIRQGFPGTIVKNFYKDKTAPILETYDLDMNTNELSLTFTEPVNAAKFDATQITLQGEPNVTDEKLEYTLSSASSTTSPNGRFIVITLSPSDVNAIKARSFAKSRNDTYIRLTETVIEDMAYTPNLVQPVVNGQAVRVIGYTLDMTAPELSCYQLNLDKSQLILTFNEPVIDTSLVCDRVHLHSHSTSGQGADLTLTDCQVVAHTDNYGTSIVTIDLSRRDVTTIKTDSTFGSQVNNTYLSIDIDAVNDTSMVGVVNASRVQTCEHRDDLNRPSLTKFNLDIENGFLNLTFDDVVVASTLKASAFTIQNALTASLSVTLSDASRTSSPDGYAISIALSHEDLFRIKSVYGLATGVENTYLTLSASAVDDHAGFDVTPITDGKAKKVSVFVQDTTEPRLVSFDLDMDRGLVTLSFSDTVNTTTFVPQWITLHGNNSGTSLNASFSITGGNVERSEDGTAILLFFSVEDLNEVKRNTRIATSSDTSYLSIRNATIQDLARNDLIGISASDVIQVSQFTNDSTSPELLHFDVDMDARTLTLEFLETVRASTITPSAVTIQSVRNATMVTPLSHTLEGGRGSVADSTIVVLYLSDEDVNALNRIRGLATSMWDSYLVVTSTMIADMNDNFVEPIESTSGLRVRMFTQDVTRPSLVSFDLNMDSGNLTMTFDEVINARRFLPTEITLHEATNRTNSTTLTITGGTTSVKDDTVIDLAFSIDDLNELKRLEHLAIDVNSSYLTLTSLAAEDMNGNQIHAINVSEIVRVATFTSDTTEPVLVTFSLDIDSGVVTLVFDETVRASTFVIGRVLLLNSSSGSSSSVYRLNTSSSSVEDSTTVVISLSADDQNAIKLNRALATDANQTYILLEAVTVEDMNRNSLVAMTTASRVVTYTADLTPPRLSSYVFDLNFGQVTLTFNEAVDSESLKASTLTIQSTVDTNVSTLSYTLTSSSGTATANGVVLVLDISESDLNEIKKRSSLAIGTNSTYVSYSSDFVSDMAYHKIVEESSGKQTAIFVNDVTPPELRLFELDLQNGTLLLSFTETVNVSSLNIEKLTLQNEASDPPSTSYDLTSGSYSLEDGPRIVITLSDVDLNSIKADDVLAVGINSTYLVATMETISDMSGNALKAIVSSEAQKVVRFVEDRVRPTLVSFDLDMDTGTLTMKFSESMEAFSLRVTQLWLRDTDVNASSVHRLTGSVSDSWNYTSVTVQLVASDLNIIKLNRRLATGYGNTFLAFNATTVSDKNGNQVMELSGDRALNVSLFTPDTTPPTVTNFDLDMDHPQELDLTFDEPVDSTTINLTRITLQSGESSPASESYSLTGGTVLSNDSTIIKVAISFMDATNIQAIRALATEKSNTYLAILESAVMDMNYNGIVAVGNGSVIGAGDFVTDSTEPYLDAFTLDMNIGRLTLTFSETVDVGSFDETKLNFQRRPGSLTIVPALNLGPGMKSARDSYIIHFDLSKSDLDLLKEKAIDDLATAINTTYISFVDPNTVVDMVGNTVVTVLTDTAKVADVYIRDSTPVKLLDFNFDMSDEGILLLTFSETVDVTTLNATAFEFRNSRLEANATSQVSLTSVEALNTNAVVVRVKVSEDDMNVVKRHVDLATSTVDTYLFLYSEAINDMAGNLVSGGNGSAIAVTNYTADVTRPLLTSFGLDMDSSVFSLTFSETVNSSSLYIPGIQLQPNSDANHSLYRLTEGVGPTSDYHILDINISVTDLNEIKKLTRLATSPTNTYVSITNLTVQDMVGLPVRPLSRDSALIVTNSEYVRDRTAPIFERFSLDVDAGTLEVTFDETVAVSSLGLTTKHVTFMSDINGTQQYTLSGGSLLTTDAPVVRLRLAKIDLDALKLDTNLATTSMNTYLRLKDGGVTDMSDNSVRATTHTVSVHTPDTTSPMLVTFSMDLDLGVLYLNFDEPVDVDTLLFDNITLQSSSSGGFNYTLTGGSTNNNASGLKMDVQLTTVDLNEIKKNSMLFVDENSTYISFPSTTVRDMVGNYVREINDSSATRSSLFVSDTTSPRVLAFDLDMNVGALTMRFSETVDVSSIDVTGITLQVSSDVDSPTDQYTLVDRRLTANVDGTELTLNISLDDLNNVKARGIGLSNARTWMLLSNTSIVDMNGRYVVPRLDGINAVGVDNYTTDTTRPTLDSFNINFSEETITLSFSETVDASSINVTLFTILSDGNSSIAFTLTETSEASQFDRPVIVITMSEEDLNELKKQPQLAVSKETTRLSITADSVTDVFGNNIIEIPQSFPLTVANYSFDTVRPVLESFNLDMNLGYLTIYFSETVNVTSLDMTEIQLLSNATDEDTVTFTFTGGDPGLVDSSVVTVEILDVDLNEIKRLTQLATPDGNTTANTFLSLSAFAIRDMNDQPVEEIIPAAALSVDVYTQDSILPKLVSFALDLDTGVIDMQFSETVNASSFDVTHITIRNDEFNASEWVSLTSGTLQGSDATSLRVNMSVTDLNELKRLTGLATSQANTFISATQLAVSDMNGNLLIERLINNSLQTELFTSDRTRPYLVSYDLDMNGSNMTLTFSETVNSSSFRAFAFTFQNGRSVIPDVTNSYTLTASSTLQETGDDTVLIVKISTDDVNNLKKCPRLATSANTTYLSWSQVGIRDMDGNTLIPRDVNNGLRVNDYIQDCTRPRLVGFDVDMNTGQLTLRFSEAVNRTTLGLDKFSVQESASPSNVTHRLEEN